jgi:transposase InsO family protein
MRIFNKFRGTKGWLWLYERQLQLARMHNQAEAERRLRVLIFWEKHGDAATMEAFDVSRRTLFRWQEVLRRNEGKLLALDKRSTAPKRRRVRRITPELEARILTLRRAHYKIGKAKIASLCSISESKAGRILSDLKKRGLLATHLHVRTQGHTGRLRITTPKKKAKLRRPKEYKRGIEIDTVIRFINGTKRYIYTAIDIERKFAFGGAYTNHSSESAADFLGKLIQVAPFKIREIQTDNGSEFAHLFHDACKKRSIRHYHTYPRCPKMNGTVERFNRTLSEEFLAHQLALLKDDLDAFNEALVEYLLWYNAERPHQSLGMLSPLQYIVKTLPKQECQMWWTRTMN